MLDNSMILEQRQTMSTNQIQSLEILSFTNQELENFLTSEYLENPILENSHDKQTEMIKDLEQMYEKNISYHDHYQEWADDDCNRNHDIRAADLDEMKNHLLGQLHKNEYNDMEWELMEYLIYCLNDEGFFIYETSDIAKRIGLAEETVCKCLKLLKTLEPVGIFSRDISECLKKQLQFQKISDEKLWSIVDAYMPSILAGHIGIVSRDLHLSTAKVKEYMHFIGSLNPRPIMNMQSPVTQYIVPDILVTREKDEWQITINDNWMGEYKYNGYYIKMMQSSNDEELIQYFKEKLDRARFILNCVEQRRQTIIRVIEAILNAQEDFFLTNTPLKPLSMEEIARRTNLHVSTVSRAIKDKYLQYKTTVFIKDLFPSSIAQSDVPTDSIKDLLKKMIRDEDSKNPLSDLKIAEKMTEKGIHISRRTITKYRKQMGLPESRQRLYL